MVTMKYYNPLFILALTLAPICHAGQLVYKPLNPSFGGNPLNGSFLLSKAQAQNKHKANLEQKSSADKLKESIERAYINKIVKEVQSVKPNALRIKKQLDYLHSQVTKS